MSSFGFRRLRDRAEYYSELIGTSTPVYMRRSDCSDEPKRSRQTIPNLYQRFRAVTATAPDYREFSAIIVAQILRELKRYVLSFASHLFSLVYRQGSFVTLIEISNGKRDNG